jgi:uncharacterized membrane protein YcaP (DUF421 family)
VLRDLSSGFTWIDFADKAIRTVAVYGTLLLLLRLGGKRQLAQLSTFDFVVILLLSNVVQNAIIGNDNTLVGGLVGAAILIAINFVVVFFAFLNPRLERDLRGRETPLVEHGEPLPDELRRELISPSELEAALRRQGYRGLDAVEEVVLEPEGTLAVTEKEHATIGDVLAALRRIEQRLPNP